MTNRQAVRWNIFAGIMFTVVGMCFLNYYSLFPQAEISDRKKYDDTEDETTDTTKGGGTATGEKKKYNFVP